MYDNPTLGVSTIIDVYHALVKEGLDQKDFLNTCEITEEQLYNPDTRISASALPKIWELALNHSSNPAIGLLVGSQVVPEQLSIVAQAFFQSKNLRQGVEQYTRFYRLVNESIEIALEEGPKYSRLIFTVEPEFYHCSEMERSLASGIARSQHFLGKQVFATRFLFQHSEPSYIDKYRELFNAEILFDQQCTAIEFETSLLNLPIKNRNPYLYEAVTQHAESLLRRLKPRQSLTDQVYRFIRRNLARDNLDVVMAANHLNISRHTLYRKLKKYDMSFQSMVEEVRKNEAQKLLKDKEVSVSEVAFLLGFSELSAFSRAFKRWTGVSPAHFRQNNSDNNAS